MPVDFGKLGLTQEKSLVDYENVPEQFGPRTPPLQPGSYHFQLPPQNVLEDISNWDKKEGGGWKEVKANAEKGKPQRVSYSFDADHPLTVVHCMQFPDSVGSVYRGRISNVERNRARRGEPEQMVSDMLYLLRFGFEDAGKWITNQDYMEALISHAGGVFQADTEFSAYAKAGDLMKVYDSAGAIVDHPAGATWKDDVRIYQKDIPKDPNTGLYLTTVQVGNDGGVLYCNANLARFKKVG